MSTLHRFRGTALAALLLTVALVAWIAVERGRGGPVGAGDLQVRIFSFEEDDLTGFRIVRPDATLEMRRTPEGWEAVGHSWRPSRSMVRRVGHQLHDLTARAVVVDAPEDYGVYGLGPDAVEVTLTLRDGRTLAFRAGDPNPSGVSWYIRPLPGERVYVVKKSALDYFRLELEAFREPRFATFDAREVERLQAEVGGRALQLHRIDEHAWQQTAPVTQRASRDRVRMMLGRVSAMKAVNFVEDEPTDLARYGLEPPTARVEITPTSGRPITVLFGDPVPGADPPLRYVMRLEDDAVYAVRDSILDAYDVEVQTLRDPVILGRREWEVVGLEVEQDGETVTVQRTADAWRWSDGAAVGGSTPRRVAAAAAEVRALAFHDDTPLDPAAHALQAEVRLTFDDGAQRTISLGRRWEVPVDEAPEGEERTEERQLAWVDGDVVAYEVDGLLGRVVGDLHREHARKRQRDAERGPREP